MTGKKATSEAPPPINPIRGGGYRPRKSKPANYQHWNRFPLLTFDQCLMLLLGVEPGTKTQEPSVREKYDRLWELIGSCRSAGTLPSANQWNLDEIEPLRFIEWAKSMGEKIPEDWSPSIAPETSGKTIEATDKGVTKKIRDSVIIDAIADDIYIRIGASAEVSSRVGGQKLFDFLDLEQKTELSTRYQLPVSSYWVIDDKPGPRGPYEIGQKIGLSWVKILYKRKDTNDRGSIPFRKVWDAFNEIKSR